MSPQPTQTLRTIHVVVTCTDRKTRQVRASLRARSVLQRSLESRVAAWTTVLDSAGDDAVPAEELYAGDHWQVVRGLRAVPPAGIDVQTWVCSAGYGLIRLSTPIRPYEATFEHNHPDAVAPKDAGYTTTAWWDALATWRPEGMLGPRTVAGIALSSPDDFLLVAVSGLYAAALSADLERAVRNAAEGDRIAIVSAGGRPTDALRRQVVPADARLKGTLGGAMQSLNARIARQAIAEASSWYPSQRALSSLVQSWLDAAPPTETYDREKLDDDSVRAYIRRSLNEDPRVTHTRLLRSLRDGGRACEQARFAALFREVQAERVDREGVTRPGAPSAAEGMR